MLKVIDILDFKKRSFFNDEFLKESIKDSAKNILDALTQLQENFEIKTDCESPREFQIAKEKIEECLMWLGRVK